MEVEMDFKDVLTKLELPEEKVTAIVGAMNENKLYVTSEENAETRLAKFKEERDGAITQIDELKATNEQLMADKSDFEAKITEMTEQGGSNDESKAKIAELQKQLDESNGNYASLSKQQKLENALREAGATDVDYVGYKLGGVDKVELDDDGQISGWDDLLGGIKEKMPKYFADNQEVQTLGAGLKGDNTPVEMDPFQKIAQKYAK